MPITQPGDAPSNPRYRWVLPVLLGLVAAGILAPVLVARHHNSIVEANQNATIDALKEYGRLQSDLFSRQKRYAASFGELSGDWAQVKDMTAATPTEFHGYRFKLFASQAEGADGGAKNFIDKEGRQSGGHAVMAVPVHYGYTGRFTFFMAAPGNRIYYHDFGPRTDTAARVIAEYFVPAGAKAFE